MGACEIFKLVFAVDCYANFADCINFLTIFKFTCSMTTDEVPRLREVSYMFCSLVKHDFVD